MKKRPAIDRFVEKYTINPVTGCWDWTAYRTRDGYGKFRHDGQWGSAHRYSHELHKRPVPNGLEIDHTCRNRACVNPDHLEAVTHRENCRRGRGGEFWAAKTHCPRGHPYDEANTIMNDGSRVCRICNRKNTDRYQRENQDKIRAANKRKWASMDPAKNAARNRARRDRYRERSHSPNTPNTSIAP